MKFREMPYERIDFDQASSQLLSLKEELHAAKSGEEQWEIHKRFYALTDAISTQVVLAHIRHDIDMTDDFYNAENDFYDEKSPVLHHLQVDYLKELFYSPYKTYLEEKIGPVAFKNIELSMRSMDEKLIPLMQEENTLRTRYNKILATAEIEWEGEILNMSLMTPYLHHKDREVRRRAWEKYAGFLAGAQEEIEDIFDKLVKNRTDQATKLGYSNYLPLGYDRMQRNCYDRSMVETFRQQVKEDLVPLATQMHEERRKRLGVAKLSYIDEGVYFLEGNPLPVLSPDGILDAGRKLYGELSPETKEFMDFMCENELFDVYGKKTKRTGGYMTYLPLYHAPFIFANFNGTSGDVNVITHECGHAFQGYLSGRDPVREHADITMETAETHSMSMEFFTGGWMELFFGERAGDYRQMHLEDSVCFIPYGTMVDEFQDICYTNPGLTPRQRNEAWRDLERQYKPHLDYEDNAYYNQGTFWQKQHHIFNYPLYYIDYCLAQTGALQYKAWMDRNFKEAWDSYLKLCKLSASDFYTGLLTQVGLDSPFEKGTLARVAAGLVKN